MGVVHSYRKQLLAFYLTAGFAAAKRIIPVSLWRPVS